MLVGLLIEAVLIATKGKSESGVAPAEAPRGDGDREQGQGQGPGPGGLGAMVKICGAKAEVFSRDMESETRKPTGRSVWCGCCGRRLGHS